MSAPQLDIADQELAIRGGHHEVQGLCNLPYDCVAVVVGIFHEFLINRFGNCTLVIVGTLNGGNLRLRRSPRLGIRPRRLFRKGSTEFCGPCVRGYPRTSGARGGAALP